MKRHWFTWDSDADQLLLALRDEGLSFGAITARLRQELEIDVSRSAVIGRYMRLMGRDLGYEKQRQINQNSP